MSWGRDVSQPDLPLVPGPVPGGLEPQLLPPTRQEIRAGVAARTGTWTPEWTSRDPDDAGVALLRVHGTLAEAVHQRLNRLPRRIWLDGISLAGARAAPAGAAAATLAVQLAERATKSVDIPAGTVFTTPAGPDGPVLEVTVGCTAQPGQVAMVAARADGVLSQRPGALDGLHPFGARPAPPAEFWIAIHTAAVPAGVLTLAVELMPPPGRPEAADAAFEDAARAPVLRWETVSAADPAELVVERDETRALTRSGVIGLRVPGAGVWSPVPPPGRPGDPPLLWLRARLLSAGFPVSARLRRVVLNGVPASAARSVRDEVAEPAQREVSGRSAYRLSQRPVLPGSVVLEITDDTNDPFGTGADDGTLTEWRQVPSLAGADPSDRVFTLDPGAGLLTFGDGVQGRAVPDGYRNVIARVYRSGGGRSGLPAVDDVLPPLRSMPGLTGAAVLAISSGADAEDQPGLLRRGPAAIRSRLRAVAPADYATLALTTPGADVARAHCLPGQHPDAPGRAAPGTLGLIVVPRVSGAVVGGPPVPSAADLAEVARHLARVAGVAGARVVAAGPQYRRIAVQGLVLGAPGTDLAGLVGAVRNRIDAWLDPVIGGDDGGGWPFGGTVGWNALVRMLLGSVPGLEAVSRLSFRVDGRRLAPCADVPLGPGMLVWPGGHVLEALGGTADAGGSR